VSKVKGERPSTKEKWEKTAPAYLLLIALLLAQYLFSCDSKEAYQVCFP